MNVRGEQFGNARFLEAIDRGRTEPLREGIAMLLEEISRWQGGERPQDDISILAVEVAPASTRDSPIIKALTPADAVPGAVEPALR